MKAFFTIYSGDIEVHVSTEGGCDFEQHLRYVERSFPFPFLVQGIDVIYVQNFQDLNKRELNAAYADGAIYFSDEERPKEEMMSDFVHEIAHSLEERFGPSLYGDSKIEIEFLKKLNKLLSRLNGLSIEVPFSINQIVDNPTDWDKFLYEDVGYEILDTLTADLFCSPYGATSIREYWANSFEGYFCDNKGYVEMFCPCVAEKIQELDEL